MNRMKRGMNRVLSVVLSAAMLLSLCSDSAGLTVWAAIEPEAGTGRTFICEKEEHTHSDTCYEQGLLICEKEETEGHSHDTGCYELLCTSTEEGHEHTEECYAETIPENTVPAEETAVGKTTRLFQAIVDTWFAECSGENTVEAAVNAMDEETLELCAEQTTAAMDAYDSLTEEEAEEFQKAEPVLYSIIMEELAGALATRMNEGISLLADTGTVTINNKTYNIADGTKLASQDGFTIYDFGDNVVYITGSGHTSSQELLRVSIISWQKRMDSR